MNPSNPTPDTQLQIYPVPSVEVSPHFAVEINGQSAPAYHTGVAAFVVLAFTGQLEVKITVQAPIHEAHIRPLSRGIESRADGETLAFVLTEPGNFSVEIQGLPPLFVFANSIETNVPDRSDPRVHFFAVGEAYEVGVLEIGSDETVYIEGGALVRGAILAADAQNVTIRGHGVFDGGVLQGASPRHSIQFEKCGNVLVEDIVMIHPTMWMLVPALCDQVVIRNLKQIGEVVSSDGIDVVGSQDVLIEGCFLRNNDDCIVIKATNQPGRPHAKYSNWGRDVKNVEARGCVLLNAQAGNAMEIGFEMQTESISDITFRDIDVIGAHGEGGVFTIHNGDRALVSDVLWEDIRVEHFYDKLVDFRILNSRWSHDAERGQIRNIRFKNIHTIDDVYNTPSLIGGFDAEHTVEGVTFEEFWLGDKLIASPDDLHLFIKHAADIEFLSEGSEF